MLLASMPAHAGVDGARILREVWPMELIARESDPFLSTKDPVGHGLKRIGGLSA